MARDRQHYLQQMFQKGFLDMTEAPHGVWVYRRLAAPEKLSTKVHGQEDHFYTDEADLALTDFERRSANTIQHARQAPEETILDSAKIAQIVTSLEMRSRFIRQEFSFQVERAINALSDIFINPMTRSKVIVNFAKRNPEIRDSLIQFTTLGRPQGSINEELIYLAIEQYLESSPDGDPLAARDFNKQLLLHLQTSARKGQSKAICGGFSDIERTVLHTKRTYMVLSTQDGLILPDTYLAQIGKKGITPLASHQSFSEECIIPISAYRYIYGFIKHQTRRSTRELNSILATCSFENFVANSNSQIHTKLRNKIGKNASLMTKRETKELFSQGNLLSLVNEQSYPYRNR